MKIYYQKASGWIDPNRVFLNVCRQSCLTFLDSAPAYKNEGRWSIIGVDPYIKVRSWPEHTRIFREKSWYEIKDQSPLLLIKSLLEDYTIDAYNELMPDGHDGTHLKDKTGQDTCPELPLWGGCMGAIAYEAGFPLVDLPLQPEQSTQPWLSFDFYDRILIFDHETKQIWLQVCGQNSAPAEALAELRKRLNETADQALSSLKTVSTKKHSAKLISQPDKAHYVNQVECLRHWIASGEVYIANYTGRLVLETSEDSVSLYQRMRTINPAPFAAFMRQDDLEWLSSSPERFLQIKTDGYLETKPIKGTRPRGATPALDDEEKKRLLASEKDRSELLMIVDLERNDISRVCQPDSVRVKDLYALESYPTVHHLVATVCGQLQTDCQAVDAMIACFPGGSITGAPKRRAMQLIQQLEQDGRGYYTGCLGYFSADGQADFNILIRTMLRGVDGKIVYGAGGGITWESDPQQEYQEMLDKATALFRLMQLN